MSDTPHQVQRKLEVRVDSDRLLRSDYVDTPETYPRIFGNYVMQPTLRNAKWIPLTIAEIIGLSAKRHCWRIAIAEELKKLGDDDD